MNALLLAYLSAMFCGRTPHSPAANEGVRCWFEDLMHEDPSVRDDVRRYLVKLGPCAASTLVQMLDDRSPELSRWAADTLVEMGENAITPLRHASATSEPGVQRAAGQLLRRLGA